MKKKILQVPGLRDAKSIHSAGLRSIPKVQRSTYLELYNLQREKDRLDREICAMDKRKSRAEKQLEGIGQRMEALQKEARKELKGNLRKSGPANPLKKMSVNY
jgi:predicted  nucleic acid-binding Zn-ribbon protein